ncbi:MAG: hypothetical protein SGI88_17720 [Candidatus Hydrogenedentes bacterium]|nr:hypothetical protein [Candidatus Hydrogenedentota bacterium]
MKRASKGDIEDWIMKRASKGDIEDWIMRVIFAKDLGFMTLVFK